MSFASWIAEFYPISAREAATSPEAALAHSVQKWRGLLSHNLKKHGVLFGSKSVFAHGEHDMLVYGGTTCALCIYYLDVRPNTCCDDCPIVKNGGIACWMDEDEDEKGNIVVSNYEKTLANPSDDNIRAMISLMTGKEEPK